MEHTVHVEPVEIAPKVGRLDRDDIDAAVRSCCGPAVYRLQSEIRANSQLVEQVNAFECQHGLTACPRASSCDCPPMAAEACTEIGADLSARELDAVFPLNRYFRTHPALTWFAVVLVILVLAGWAGAGDLPLEVVR